MEERVKQQQHECQSEKIRKAAMSLTHLHLTVSSDIAYLQEFQQLFVELTAFNGDKVEQGT